MRLLKNEKKGEQDHIGRIVIAIVAQELWQPELQLVQQPRPAGGTIVAGSLTAAIGEICRPAPSTISIACFDLTCAPGNTRRL